MAISVSEAFTQQELEISYKTFTLFDKDQDGVLTLLEAKTALDKFGHKMSQSDFDSLLSDLGIGDIEAIEFETFKVLLMKKKELPIDNDQETTEFFLMQRDEIREMLQEMGENISEEEFDTMFRDAEFNEEGEITLLEYIRILNLC